MKLKQILAAYSRIENATATKLKEDDVIKLLKARKAMRPYVNEYKDFLKDAQDKFKPENWAEIERKIEQWRQEGDRTTLTEEERIEINKVGSEYDKKVQSAVKDELEKEIEIEFEKLSENADTKLMIENRWTPAQLEDIEILF